MIGSIVVIASNALNKTASVVQTKVIVPSLRRAADLKASGLGLKVSEATRKVEREEINYQIYEELTAKQDMKVLHAEVALDVARGLAEKHAAERML